MRGIVPRQEGQSIAYMVSRCLRQRGLELLTFVAMVNHLEEKNAVNFACLSKEIPGEFSYKELPTKAHNIPSMRTDGFSSKSATLMIPLLMVPETRAPASTAPPNSHTVAMAMACIMVRDREETDVAKELATSLAPIFQASRKENIMPKAKM